uniref:Elongation of very long chain fatty acids protein n=1 Tax=Pavo cristatus TaxID=9049 RepID=A0A8C9LA67_PAVCR
MHFFSDSRVRGWLLLDSYLPTFFLTVAYLLCIWLGNKFMKNRQPFSLRAHLIVYNLGITLLSLYMLIELKHAHISLFSAQVRSRIVFHLHDC